MARISTSGSLCRRALVSCPPNADLRPGYGLPSNQEQHLLLHREVDAVFGPDRDILYDCGWPDGAPTVVEAACYFDRNCDEMTDPVDALGRCCLLCQGLLLARNAVGFPRL